MHYIKKIKVHVRQANNPFLMVCAQLLNAYSLMCAISKPWNIALSHLLQGMCFSERIPKWPLQHMEDEKEEHEALFQWIFR